MKDPKREETPEIRSKSFRMHYIKGRPEFTFAINLRSFCGKLFVTKRIQMVSIEVKGISEERRAIP